MIIYVENGRMVSLMDGLEIKRGFKMEGLSGLVIGESTVVRKVSQ